MEYANLKKTPGEAKKSIKDEDVLALGSTSYLLAATRSLVYLSHCTPPDLTFAVMILSRIMSSPGMRAMTKLKRALRYPRGTTEFRITYENCGDDNDNKLMEDVDVDHAGDPNGGYSTTGYRFYSAGGPSDWKSQRQTLVTLSTVESEYVALSKAGQECV